MPFVTRLEVANVVTFVNVRQSNSADRYMELFFYQIDPFQQGEVLLILQGVDVGNPVHLCLCQAAVLSPAIPCIGEIVDNASSQLVVFDYPDHGAVNDSHLR